MIGDLERISSQMQTDFVIVRALAFIQSAMDLYLIKYSVRGL